MNPGFGQQGYGQVGQPYGQSGYGYGTGYRGYGYYGAASCVTQNWIAVTAIAFFLAFFSF
jgi:hypothetical protein